MRKLRLVIARVGDKERRSSQVRGGIAVLAEGLNPSYLLPRVILPSPYISGVVEGRYSLEQRGSSPVLIAPFYNLNARNREGSAAALS